MNSTFLNRFNIIFLLGSILLGGLFGYNFPQAASNFNFISQFVLSLLIFLSIPLLVIITILGVSQMADHKKSNRSLIKIFLFFAATTLIAVLIALPVGFLTNSMIDSTSIQTISQNTDIPVQTIDSINSFSAKTVFNFSELTNFQSPTGSGFLLTLIVLAIIFGTVIYRVEDRDKIISSFFKSSAAVLSQVIQQILKFLPIGLFFITATIFAKNTNLAQHLFNNLGIFTIGLTTALLIQMLVVYPLTIKFMGHRPPFHFLKNNFASILTVFSTGSKLASAPILYNDLEEKTDIDSRSTQMTIPLGTLFNAAGSAIYLTIAALFIFHLSNIELSLLNYLTLIIGAASFSLISSFIPNVSLVSLGILLGATFVFDDQSVVGFSLVLAGDWLFNRMAQVVNLFGDATTSAVISESFDFKTARVVRKYSKNDYTDISKKSPVKQPNEKKTKPKKEKQIKHKDRPERKPKRQDKKRSKQDDKPAVIKSSAKEIKQETPKFKEKDFPKEKISDTNLEMPPVPHHFLEDNKKSEPKKESSDSAPVAEKLEKEIKAKEKAEEKVSLSIKLKTDTFERERAKISAQLEAMKKAESKIKVVKEIKDEPEITQETESSIPKAEKENSEKSKLNDFPEIPKIPDFPPVPEIPKPIEKVKVEEEPKTAEINEDQKISDTVASDEKPVDQKMESKDESETDSPKIDFFSETTEKNTDSAPIEEISQLSDDLEFERTEPVDSIETDEPEKPIPATVYGRTKKSKSVAVKDQENDSDEAESNETADISYPKENIKFGRSSKRKK